MTFAANAAFANIEPGTYNGKDAAGQACSFLVADSFFANGMKHPLNERVNVKYGEMSLALSHPPLVDLSTLTTSFTHEVLQAVIPTESGANAFVVKMNHEKHAPESFTVIMNDWKNDTKSSLICSGLERKN